MRAAGTVCFLLAALPASFGADQKAGAPASVAPAAGAAKDADASIDAAKKQFELLKSARDSAGQKTALPRVSMPELQSGPAEALPRASKSLKPETEAKSGNWLVDAMEKARDERKERGDRKERGRGMADDRPERAGRRAEEKGDAPTETESRGAGQKEDLAGVNPLAPFLAEWMTPQDYALLGTTIQRTAEGGDVWARAGAAGVPAPGGVSGATSTAAVAGAGGPTRPGLNTPPPENPYLQLLNVPPSGGNAAMVSPPSTAPAPLSAAPTYMPPAAPPEPKPRVPDFLKPQTDEKYFKPLKRF